MFTGHVGDKQLSPRNEITWHAGAYAFTCLPCSQAGQLLLVKACSMAAIRSNRPSSSHMPQSSVCCASGDWQLLQTAGQVARERRARASCTRRLELFACGGSGSAYTTGRSGDRMAKRSQVAVWAACGLPAWTQGPWCCICRWQASGWIAYCATKSQLMVCSVHELRHGSDCKIPAKYLQILRATYWCFAGIAAGCAALAATVLAKRRQGTAALAHMLQQQQPGRAGHALVGWGAAQGSAAPVSSWDCRRSLPAPKPVAGRLAGRSPSSTPPPAPSDASKLAVAASPVELRGGSCWRWPGGAAEGGREVWSGREDCEARLACRLRGCCCRTRASARSCSCRMSCQACKLALRGPGMEVSQEHRTAVDSCRARRSMQCTLCAHSKED